MPIEEREKNLTIIHALLDKMVKMGGSDLFLTADYPPAVKCQGKLERLTSTKFNAETVCKLVHSITTDKQWHHFQENKGANFAISPQDIGRFRVNLFTQQQKVGAVIRTINTTIPDFDTTGLPPILKSLVMEKRGLLLLVGGTGSGKSTTLAAMIGARNKDSNGHIITIEDPVEYLHSHQNCIVTHREVGMDTLGWFDALKDTLRQAPDVILIGEIRDRETMEYALNFAETGHLCLATLHANNANQAIDRIVNFFPIEMHEQALNNLSLNMKGIVSQRLIRKQDGGRVAAIEILLSSASSRDAVAKGDAGALKTIMAQSNEIGMKTFDQCLYDFYDAGLISLQETESNADSKGDLRLKLKLNSKRFREEELGGAAGSSSAGLSMSL